MERYLEEFLEKIRERSLEKELKKPILIFGLNEKDVKGIIKNVYSKGSFIKINPYLEYGNPKDDGGLGRRYSLKIGSNTNA